MTAPAYATPSTSVPFLIEGMTATVNHPQCAGKTYVIVRVKRTKAVIRDINNVADRGLDCPMNLIVPIRNEQGQVVYAPANPLPPTPYVATERFTTGELVRLARPFRRYTTSMVFTVLAENAGTIRIALLGGDNNRYLRIPPSGLVRVDVTSLLPGGNV